MELFDPALIHVLSSDAYRPLLVLAVLAVGCAWLILGVVAGVREQKNYPDPGRGRRRDEEQEF